MATHQAPPSLGFSRQEHWSGLPFPSPMHESEKWKGSRSVVSDSSWPHGLQPTRLLHPWDFPGKSTGVGCHCLLCHRTPRWWEFLFPYYVWNMYFEYASASWLKPTTTRKWTEDWGQNTLILPRTLSHHFHCTVQPPQLWVSQIQSETVPTDPGASCSDLRTQWLCLFSCWCFSH